MTEQIVQWLTNRWRLPADRVGAAVRSGLVLLAAAAFLLATTLIVAFDSIFVGFNDIATLEVGSLAPRDIFAPPNAEPFVSDVLTQQAIEAALIEVGEIYDPADPEFARAQSRLAEQILAYIDEIRANPFDSLEQKVEDLGYIIDIGLDEPSRVAILQTSDETWATIKDEVSQVLLRVMRQDIRPSQLQNRLAQIQNQVSPRFSEADSNLIVALVRDLVQANTFVNETATQLARDEAVAAVEPQTRQFTAGQIVVVAGQRIDALAHEALRALGLLSGTEDTRGEIIGRAMLASLLVFMVGGLYLMRFAPELLDEEPALLALVTVLFLLMLAAMRLIGIDSNAYLFPSTTLALVCVAVAGPHVALIATLGLALLAGISAGDSLQVTALIAASGIAGIVGVQRAERLNAFFVAGVLVAITESLLVILFWIVSPAITENIDLATLILLTIASGLLLVPAATIAIMYVVTMAFNLPTVLRLIDLSQPSKPLLQRMLREAPGTYQHSLQVANLAEQAANAIGADAQLTHVAALYHDIGKMLTPLFFTENQQNIGNPHDTLDDPYRSAGIIIGHVTEGDELARQHRLPRRMRDFIREHHGTTQVYVFYQRALKQVDGDASALDSAEFTYPGPKPQSKETAILMLADSCEAAVRSVQPNSKEAISALVSKIFDDKRQSGQLDQSNLTLNDLHQIQEIFVDILQGMFHPRIKYDEAINREANNKQAADPAPSPEPAAPPPTTAPPEPAAPVASEAAPPQTKPKAPAADGPQPPPSAQAEPMEIEDEEPLTEVPRLPSIDQRRTTTLMNGLKAVEETQDTPLPESDDTP